MSVVENPYKKAPQEGPFLFVREQAVRYTAPVKMEASV